MENKKVDKENATKEKPDLTFGNLEFKEVLADFLQIKPIKK